MKAQLGSWRARLAAGERRIGWKVALNTPVVQRQLGISKPVIGYLTSGTELAPGASHSLAGGTRVSLEPEIAIRIHEDLEAGSDRAAAEAAIGAFAPAIELVDIDLPFDDLERILAANVFHRAVMLGASGAVAPRTGWSAVSARVLRNGFEEASAQADEDPAEIVSHVANLLGRVGERLRAGDTIISGSLIAPVWVEPGDRFEVVIDPLGTLAIDFTP